MRRFGYKLVFAVSVLALSIGSFLPATASSTAPILPTLSGTCSADSVPLIPTGHSTFPDGGAQFDYTIDGVVTHQLLPPANFRPARASSAELRRYNFPARPSANTPALAAWTSRWSKYSGVAHARLCNLKNLPSAPAQPASQAGYGTNNIWSGYLVHKTAPIMSGNNLSFANASLIQSGITCPACTAKSSEVTWVGVGGYGSSVVYPDQPAGLFQAGTAEGTNNGIPTKYYAWWEYLYPCPSKDCAVGIMPSTQTYTLSPGDTVTASVSNAYDEQQYLVMDGRYTILDASTSLNSGDFDGGTAEFINERPTIGRPGNPYDPLTDYHSTAWTASCAGNYRLGTCYNPTDLQPDNLQMVDDGSSVPENEANCGGPGSGIMSYPSGLTDNHGESFSSFWCKYS